ncbi:cysteine desulfurase family protein [Paenibacillus thalictri]|uniref:cysteine desulfurase n=1 Tax=Paenibacillus thalictri TaxID=2527873 RepID=A0A4Q9DYR7_9BACL|nr:cysteine desulfurase family protein [Paenibacillus thalictri]TBL81585.1 cysteine desulfurase [Paenibacillus thalictri]
MSIYLDHAATTPVHPEVLDAMLPYYSNNYGNASSTHNFGRAARAAIHSGRDQMAELLGCRPNELTFTSGGTESDNTAIIGIAETLREKGRHIITTAIEHHAVLHTCGFLERFGYDVTYLPVDEHGRIRLDDLERAIRPDTILISVMYANNEIGTIQPIVEIGELARSKGILFHTDAVQALGHLNLRLNDLPVDLAAFSAHKIHGPKGIGALYVAGHVQVAPLLHGGNQERKRRPGTENVAGIAGFAKALQISIKNMYEMQQNLEKLRQVMVDGLFSELNSGFVVNGDAANRVPHILNVSFPGVSTETMLMNLDLEGIAAASGSACTSGSLEVSHVLKAMRLPEDVVSSAVRFSFGRDNNEFQVQEAVHKIATIVRRIRNTK